jgi:Fe2+ transport system protein FeoA
MAFELVEANSLGAGEGCGRRERRRWGWGRGRREDGHGCGEEGHCRRRLCEAGAGDTLTVTGLLGDEAFRGRVMAMGILPGVTLEVVGGGRPQPLLVALPGSRCVVDQHSSEMIEVRGARPVAKHERTGT